MVNSYFPHDSNARNSEKLLKLRMKHGAEGYGVYFMILERLREENGYTSVKDYQALGFDFRVADGLVKSIVEDFGLFSVSEEGNSFYSESFQRRMKIMDKKQTKRTEAAKKAAEARWGKQEKSEGNANALQTHSESNADDMRSDANKKKLKETKPNKTKPKDNSMHADKQAPIRIQSIADFEKLWAFPNHVQRETILEFVDQYGDDLVTAAIKLAGSKDVVKGKAINFLTSALKEWSDNNVITVEQAREYQKTRGKQQSGYKRSNQRTESMPKWANNHTTAEDERVSEEEEAAFREKLKKIRERKNQHAGSS